MAGTHFKGPLLFSSARASLENLKQSMWPDQLPTWMISMKVPLTQH